MDVPVIPYNRNLFLVVFLTVVIVLLTSYINHDLEKLSTKLLFNQNSNNISISPHFSKNGTSTQIYGSNDDVAVKLDYISKILTKTSANCAEWFTEPANDQQRNKRKKFFERLIKKSYDIPDRHFHNMLLYETQTCDQFRAKYGFIMDSLTQEEKDFPIAYSLVVHKTPEMVLRLLRAIYRPHNYYCIHVDEKKDTNSDRMYRSLSSVSSCLPNVFMSSSRVNVTWGEFSVLDPELICMADLWNYKKWKYFINLTGQEFPLKNNYEIVKILKSYKGANDVRGTHKFSFSFRINNRRIPFDLTLYKSPVHIVVNRDFVDFVLHDHRAQVLKEFLHLNKTKIPDETFFALLNHNPSLGIHGSFLDQKEEESKYPKRTYVNIKQSFLRHKIWYYYPEERHKCSGRWERYICMLSTGDLWRLKKSPALFGNKFKLHEDRVVIGCLEELNTNKTRDYYRGNRRFNTTIYATSDLVTHRLINDTQGKWET